MFFHTIIGATLVGVIAAEHGRRCCEIAIGIWNEELKGSLEKKWLTIDRYISKTSACAGALLGAWSHLILDSFMHFDIKPLSLFTDSNPLLGAISIGWLHTICIGLGLIGFLLLMLKRR